MNKAEMIKMIAMKTGLKQKDAREAIDAFHETLLETLATGEDVTVAEGLKFFIREVPERTCRNPRTDEPLVVPAHKAVKVKLGNCFKKLEIA